MATVRKRGRSWQVQIRRLGIAPRSRSFATKAEALKWARQTEAVLDVDGAHPSTPDLSAIRLDDLLARYRESETPRKKSRDKERNRIDRLRRHPLVRLTLDRLTPGVFAQFRDERMARVGPQAVVHDLNLFQHVIKVAMGEWGIPLTENPLQANGKPAAKSAQADPAARADAAHNR